jgi:hypothetical protein
MFDDEHKSFFFKEDVVICSLIVTETPLARSSRLESREIKNCHDSKKERSLQHTRLRFTRATTMSTKSMTLCPLARIEIGIPYR